MPRAGCPPGRPPCQFQPDCPARLARRRRLQPWPRRRSAPSPSTLRKPRAVGKRSGTQMRRSSG
eukprot:7837681-Pyramimonas_sp.AAC.1